MWSIAICDDEEQVHKEIVHLLQMNGAEDCQVEHFTNGADLLQSAVSKQYDLIYLDIQMPGLNGVETARALRQQHCAAAIWFLTNFDDYLEIGYEVQAFRYRFKPLDPIIFAKDFCAWQQWQKTHGVRSVSVIDAGSVQQVAVQDIIYLEIVHRKVQIVTVSGVCSSTEDMGYWENTLGNTGFLSPYNKILVNVEHVKFFDSAKVIVTGDVTLPMSRRKYQTFRKAMLQS